MSLCLPPCFPAGLAHGLHKLSGRCEKRAAVTANDTESGTEMDSRSIGDTRQQSETDGDLSRVDEKEGAGASANTAL